MGPRIRLAGRLFNRNPNLSMATFGLLIRVLNDLGRQVGGLYPLTFGRPRPVLFWTVFQLLLCAHMRWYANNIGITVQLTNDRPRWTRGGCNRQTHRMSDPKKKSHHHHWAGKTTHVELVARPLATASSSHPGSSDASGPSRCCEGAWGSWQPGETKVPSGAFQPVPLKSPTARGPLGQRPTWPPGRGLQGPPRGWQTPRESRAGPIERK